MKTILIISLIFLSGFLITCAGQSSTDSTVIKYLRTVKDIPSPVLEIAKKKNKTLRSANFFIEPTDSLKHGNVKLTTFLFGSSASHARKYFLLQIVSSSINQNKIIDNLSLENAIESLFALIKEFGLANTEKSILVRQLTYAYN